jgi:3-dehydroquinate dehydratase II
MTKILLIQGPNLSYLGKREPDKYGTMTAAELDGACREHARRRRYELELFYTHVEGFAIERIYKAVEETFDALVMNPAGMTYNGYALRDCLLAVAPALPYVEVHIRHIENAGTHSVPVAAARGSIFGFGAPLSYILGLDAALAIVGHMD